MLSRILVAQPIKDLEPMLPPSGFGGPRAKGSKGEASCERSELKIFATTPIILALNYHSFEMFHFLKNNLFTSN